MNKVIKAVLCIGMLALAGLTSNAQSSTLPPPPPSAITNIQNTFSAAQDWLSSYDTNSTTFASTKLDLWTGMNYQKGLNTSMELGLSYRIGSTPIGVEGIFRNVNAGGDLMSYAGGFNVQWSKYDVKLEAYFDGGENQVDSRMFVEVGGRIFKSYTHNTSAMIGVGLGKEFGSRGFITPTFLFCPLVGHF